MTFTFLVQHLIDFVKHFCFITAHIRRMMEGNIFSLFTPFAGGYPHPADAAGNKRLVFRQEDFLVLLKF